MLELGFKEMFASVLKCTSEFDGKDVVNRFYFVAFQSIVATRACWRVYQLCLLLICMIPNCCISVVFVD